jgi:2-polyprenyl-6-methoxyphenol hydroxylase-like FAD-dependent oxidoreductase
VTNHFLPGVVVIGDAFQSVSPATGSGLSKVLTDVKTLSNTYIPMWKNKQRIDSADVMAFYHHQEKLACDKRSLKSWYYSDFAPNERASLPSRVRRRVAFSLRYRAQKLA